MAKLIPFYTRRISAVSPTATRATDLSDRDDRVLGPQHISILARLLELVPRLDEIATRIETLHLQFPAPSLEFKRHLDRRKAELLSEIDRAKQQAVDLVMSTLAQHQNEPTKQGENNEH